jgi:predicted transcriptional regulator
MKLTEVKDILEAEIIDGHDMLDLEVSSGAASDLMSDLLRNPREGALLLTGLTSVQAIRTTIIAEMAAVVFVRGKRPDPEVCEYAREHNLPLLSTPLNMYSSCGRLFSRGLPSIR